MTIDDLADLLKSRECEAIWYFHTDHFEPWSYDIDDNSARAVERFAAMERSSHYARKLSLFYSVFIPYRLATGGNNGVDAACAPGDSIVFGARSPRQEALAREVVRPLVDADEHEIHLHVHHEFWTRNTSDFDNPVSRWVNQSSTPDLDRARLDLYFRLCNEVIGRELGRPFEHWAFVHGNWALNASDPLICHVEDEITMMMRHGGWGDFSFPAGRGYCDPKLEAPFTCLPLALPRVYDDPASDPRPIGAGTGVLSRDRFFIWNSPIKASFSSIDYYSPANRQLFKTPERVVQEWLAKSVVLDRRLFLKTHAHSMKWEYKIAEPGSVIPHCYPDVMRIFDQLARVCDRAGVELRLVTVNEVMAALQQVDCRNLHLPAAGGGGEAAAGAAIATVIDPAPISNIATVAGNARGDDAPDQREVEELAAIRELGSDSLHYILKPSFVADGGEAWTAALPAELHLQTDSDHRPSRSSLILLEDRMPLGPAHALHQRIRSEGRGLYSFWKTGLWFSTSDGSNPNTNGRIYAVASGPDAAPLRLPDRPVTAVRVPDRNEPLGSMLAAEESEVANVEVDFVSLNDAVVSWLATWANADPKHNRALGEYYQDRISRRTLLSSYDVAVVEYCRQLFCRSVTFFELGCGFGELCLMLALDGFRVLGFEVDGGRCEGAAVLASKAAETLSRPIDLTFANGIFPEALNHEMLGHDETVIVCTGVTSTYMAEHSEQLIESLRLFNHVIVDVTRFGLVRDSEAQAELIRSIMVLGYTDVATVFRAGGPDIRHFSRQRITQAAGGAAILYSDVGQPVPAELQRDPLHIFFGTMVPLTRLFPHLLTRAAPWEPAQGITIFPFAIPATCDRPTASHLPVIEVGPLDDSRVHFPGFGGYYLNCQFGTVKCLILDPKANRDAIVIEVSRFLAGNIVHSSVDKATNWPWRNRTRYVRPDLLLRKMFMSDQPLGLECDGATDFAGYVLSRLGFGVRRVWVNESGLAAEGHVVLDVYFPVLGKWGMIDFDFGVFVTDAAGVILSTRELIIARADLTAVSVKPIVEKHWLGKQGDVGELYVGQMSWTPSFPRRGLTGEPDRYLGYIEQLFRASEEYSYRFRNGVDDNVHDIVKGNIE